MLVSKPVSEENRIAAAQSYIDALVTHDANTVPFAERCIRVEQGVKNGFSVSFHPFIQRRPGP